MRILRLFAVAVVWAMAFLGLTAPSAAPPLPRSVLVLDQYGGSLPWVGARNMAFRTLLNAGRTAPVSIYEEYLDLNRFAAPNYKKSLKLHFGEKYRNKPIGLIVAFGPLALDYAADIRDELWPATSVVFGEAAERAISRSSLPASVTGTTINITLAEMVLAARALVPDLKRIALVGDLLDNLPAYRHFKEEIPLVTRDLDFLDLTGLAMADLRRRVAALPDHTAIIYTTINLDGAGVSYVPAEALSLVAQAANRPIVISTETFLGRGAVGGFLVTPGSVGQDAARLASRILDGDDASIIAVAANSVNKPIFDWRQLQRWGISESVLPPGSDVRFRDPTAWERYRPQILVIIATLVVLVMLISWLLYERRYRQRVEIVARDAVSELSQLNRIAAAGELSASISHELNQPLTGIVTRAGAARRWLAAERLDIDKARAELDKIENAGLRAAEIVQNVRAVFRKDTNEKVPVDVNRVVLEVLALGQNEFQKHHIEVHTDLDDRLPSVTGNRVQLQQVVLNLVMNAVEAMHSAQPRRLRVQSRLSKPGVVHVSIEDTGTGVDPANVDRIFKPLFTTKASGMGMGLSICRSIIESHNGRIWVSPGAERGSIFEFELPTNVDG